jgi:hypothetical protein
MPAIPAMPKWGGFPNWCENFLTITGPEAELKRFMAQCITMEADKPRLDLDKLLYSESDYIKRSTLQPNAYWPMVGSGKILLYLQTPRITWPIYEVLAECFPLLKIESRLVELLKEFYGHICCHGGKIDYEDQSEQHKAENAKDLPF